MREIREMHQIRRGGNHAAIDRIEGGRLACQNRFSRYPPRKDRNGRNRFSVGNHYMFSYLVVMDCLDGQILTKT